MIYCHRDFDRFFLKESLFANVANFFPGATNKIVDAHLAFCLVVLQKHLCHCDFEIQNMPENAKKKIPIKQIPL